jgi:hypothetical protein
VVLVVHEAARLWQLGPTSKTARTRGCARSAPRFRTFQLCPKESSAPWYAERAANRPHRCVGCSWSSWAGDAPMLDMRRREFITLLGGAAGPSVLLLGGVAHARS